MGFSRQEYWSGLPFPSPGDLPNPGMEPESTASHTNSLPSELPGREKKSTPLISPIGDTCYAVHSCSWRPSMQTPGTVGRSHLFRVSHKRERRAIPSCYIWHYMKATRRKEEGKSCHQSNPDGRDAADANEDHRHEQKAQSHQMDLRASTTFP